jgi:17beta-estradiol 17-dehydrogenase / very-long-chain 3-oxoacyl-CoA reductase
MAEWLSILGGVVAAYWALRFLSFFYEYFIASSSTLSSIRKKCPDAWAVITGASEGIGKSYAIELAKRGFNVCLISRTKSKLDAVATEIADKYKVKTKTIPFDFSVADPSRYAPLAAELSSLPIGVLVNNAGVSFDYPVFFNDVADADIENIIQLNAAAVTRLTKIVLPKMVERKCGAVIFLSSFTALLPTPMLSVYGATKAYVHYLARTLNAEYQRHGIVVQSVTPALVHTAMTKTKKASIAVPLPSVVAANALRSLGRSDHTTPYLVHLIFQFLLSVLPEKFSMGRLLSYHKDINRRAIQKREREAAAKMKTT